MPDVDGKLSGEEKTKAIAWVTSHVKGAIVCPVCGSAEWTLGDHVVSPIALGGGGNVRLGGPGYPQVMLISQNCGHTIYINAIVAGIVSPDPGAASASGPTSPQPASEG